MANDADPANSEQHQNENTLMASALSNDSIAESGSPKFNCALPSVTQAWKSSGADHIIHGDDHNRDYELDQM